MDRHFPYREGRAWTRATGSNPSSRHTLTTPSLPPVKRSPLAVLSQRKNAVGMTGMYENTRFFGGKRKRSKHQENMSQQTVFS
jgi:hypothetical protein